MSATPTKANLFGVGGKKGRARKGHGPNLVTRITSAVKARQQEQRDAQEEQRRRDLAARRLEMAEAQQRRREWEKERREAEAEAARRERLEQREQQLEARERQARERDYLAAVRKAEQLNEKFKDAEFTHQTTGKPTEAQLGALAARVERAFEAAESMKNPSTGGREKPLAAYKARLAELRRTGKRAAFNRLSKAGAAAGLSVSRIEKDARAALAKGRRENPLEPDAAHQVEVSRHYRSGGKSKRQRAVDAGQFDFFGESGNNRALVNPDKRGRTGTKTFTLYGRNRRSGEWEEIGTVSARTSAEASREGAKNHARRDARDAARFDKYKAKEGARNPGHLLSKEDLKTLSQAGKSRGSQLVDVTPRLARRYLKRNVGNQPVDKKKVQGIAGVMRSGIFTRKKPITFTNGLLTDGQHTLLAIIESGVTVRLRVVEKTLKANPGPVAMNIIAGAAGGAAGAVVGHVAGGIIDDWRRERKAARRANPERTLAEFFEMFQGRPPGSEWQVAKSHLVPDGTWRIGRISHLPLKNGATVRFPAGCFLVGDAAGRMHIVRRLQNGRAVPPFLPPAKQGAQIKNGVAWAGKVAQFPYFGRKIHLADGYYLWIHDAAEEGGEEPDFGVDEKGYPVLKNGTYYLTREGIRD